jgi:hypothetical protein
LALDKKSREAFYAGQLTASTALLLARIPVPALQRKALKAITATWNGQPSAFKDAQRHIQDRYMTRLKDALFDAKARPGGLFLPRDYAAWLRLLYRCIAPL